MKLINKQDIISLKIMQGVALSVVLMLVLMIFLLIYQSYPAIKDYGMGFISSDWWNPLDDEFGALAFIYGTLITSFIALLIATPLSVAVAIFINEIIPSWCKPIVSLFVEMIAAVPSIVFGLWGLFFLAPFVQKSLTPFLKSYLGFLPLFQGPSFGIGILTASLILAIMIIPTISSLCREVFRSVPPLQKEAALGLGATRFEMIKLAILRPSLSGIIGAMALGLGRALGETMAVAMVIGNQPSIKASLFAPGATMASVIANEYAEADSDIHLSALCLVGLLLFVITLFVNTSARAVISKVDGVK